MSSHKSLILRKAQKTVIVLIIIKNNNNLYLNKTLNTSVHNLFISYIKKFLVQTAWRKKIVKILRSTKILFQILLLLLFLF